MQYKICKDLFSEGQQIFSIITWWCDYISLYEMEKSAAADLPSEEWGKWKVVVLGFFFSCFFVGCCWWWWWWWFFVCNEDFKISLYIHVLYCNALQQGIIHYIWRADKYAKAFESRKRTTSQKLQRTARICSFHIAIGPSTLGITLMSFGHKKFYGNLDAPEGCMNDHTSYWNLGELLFGNSLSWIFGMVWKVFFPQA